MDRSAPHFDDFILNGRNLQPRVETVLNAEHVQSACEIHSPNATRKSNFVSNQREKLSVNDVNVIAKEVCIVGKQVSN